MKLMIVDDEKLLRNGFKHMTDWCSKGIHIISEAINGQDALEKIKDEMPDVVLTDINMPIMNGIELTKRIKSQYPQIIVIVLSGYDDYQYVRESMKYGASDYLLKASIDAEEIFDLLLHLSEEKHVPLISSQTHNNIQTDSTTIEVIHIDKSLLQNLLELQKYNELSTYIEEILSKNKKLPVPYLRDLIRDIFFFIQFQMDQLGLPHKITGDFKVRISLGIQSIESIDHAKQWVRDFIQELTTSTSTNGSINIRIKHIIDLIESQYAVPDLSLSYIANSLYLNKNYLCDLFKAQTGTTINQYIANTRINKSKELMRNTSLSLNEIASTVGYIDYNYFSRVFRKKMGIPPSKYHQMYL